MSLVMMLTAMSIKQDTKLGKLWAASVRGFPLACVWGMTGPVYQGLPQRIKLLCRDYTPGICTVEWAGGPT
jgi:hypothetical protein